MAITNPTSMQRGMRLRLCFTNGIKGYLIAAPDFGMRLLGVVMSRAAFATGLAQGRIVSISRGSPPPKKR